jgi:hypothetical protein
MSEASFELIARWVETCFERRIVFAFSQGRVLIKNEVAVGFSFPSAPSDATIEAVEC